MEALTRLISACAPVAWTAAAAAYLLIFVRQDEGAARWAPRLAWTAAVVHLLALMAPGLHGVCPMLLPGSVVSGLGLAVGVVHLVVEGRVKDRAIGVFPVAAAALFALAGAAADPMRRPEALPPASTALHVTGAILGYAGMLLAALFGFLYLVQQKALKRHRFGLFWERLPSLELLDTFSRRSLAAGVVFLTLTILFGLVVRRDVAPGHSYWDAKIIATDLLWLAGLVIVIARFANRMRPGTAAIASLGLFVMALANLFVVGRFSPLHQAY